MHKVTTRDTGENNLIQTMKSSDFPQEAGLVNVTPYKQGIC
jgi:hypothetical protein